MNTIITEVKNEFPGHSKCITTHEFNMLTAENFAARFKQPNLVSKTDLKSHPQKAKHLEVLKELNSWTTKDYIFFFSRMCFTNKMDLKTGLFINQHLIY